MANFFLPMIISTLIRLWHIYSIISATQVLIIMFLAINFCYEKPLYHINRLIPTFHFTFIEKTLIIFKFSAIVTDMNIWMCVIFPFANLSIGCYLVICVNYCQINQLIKAAN